MEMEHSSWYHLQDPSAAPAPAATEPPLPQPVHYQMPPFSAEDPYLAYDYPPNPNAIPSWPDGPAPVSSHLYEAPTGGGAVQPPVVANSCAPYAGYDGYVGNYWHSGVGLASDDHGLAGGDPRGFSAKEAIRMYGVDPGSYGSNLRAPPDFSMHQNEVIHSHYGSTRKKAKKFGKVVQSAYCQVCKVDCNSQGVLISHRQGKKHKKNLEKLTESIVPKPAKAPASVAENREPPKAEEDKTANGQTEENSAQATRDEKDKTASGQKRKKPAPVTEMDLETKKRRLLEEGATEDAMRVCSVCNIVCNSEVVFNYHIAGQKHAAMVKKQAASAN
ncbi:hypothetical protein Taro_019949 [Colocasia esculenta]|uniref:Uncharacterized protein n=1 Tax=Colocasia esculenta TaxID=4460 RepID=A0A843V3R3_COLES|nr:hypothetical protein [Colocasia esculenta]